MVKYKHDPFGAGLLGIALAILAVLLFAFSSGVRASFVTVLVGGIALLLIVGAIALFVVMGLVLSEQRKEKKAKKA
ncbi:MAG: hypothetical protein MASP_01138 [Candidatus Methanolliviera sp. GoM_asphalt]|nr:MAG: hypothetical protein MASP_01138 [Candidatus Methanolliviera sp. GoM_asphalt]